MTSEVLLRAEGAEKCFLGLQAPRSEPGAPRGSCPKPGRREHGTGQSTRMKIIAGVHQRAADRQGSRLRGPVISIDESTVGLFEREAGLLDAIVRRLVERGVAVGYVSPSPPYGLARPSQFPRRRGLRRPTQSGQRHRRRRDRCHGSLGVTAARGREQDALAQPSLAT
jgi:hypothetical protein